MLTNDFRLCIISLRFKKTHADLAHPVERHLAKVEVASSSLVIRSMKRRSTSVLLFLCLLGLRGSKRPLRSKETAGGCFGGRVRVGERESEPSESRNPLHKKEEALRCFFFAFIRIAGLEKAVAKQRNSRGLFRRPCA